MKILFTDKEKEYLEKVTTGEVAANNLNMTLVDINSEGKNIGLVFQIIDPIKADIFVSSLFGDKQLENVTGVRCKEIQLKPKSTETINNMIIEINRVLERYR